MSKSTTRKEEIVVKAMKLFRERGIRGVKMSDIADEVGILKGSLYAHFESKEALLLDVLDATNTMFNEQVFRFAYMEDMDAKERMRLLNKALYAYFMDSQMCLMTSASVEGADEIKGVSGKIEVFFERWRTALSHLLETKHSKKEAARLALLSVSRVEGAAVIRRVCKTDAPLKSELEAIQALLE